MTGLVGARHENRVVGFVLSHPSDKNRNVARVGHPVVLAAPGFHLGARCGYLASLRLRNSALAL